MTQSGMNELRLIGCPSLAAIAGDQAATYTAARNTIFEAGESKWEERHLW
jgi:hypothetical protein